MKRSFNYKSTLYSCYLGYVIQAIINNFPSLIFVIFRKSFGISISQLAYLILVLFVTQLATDIFSIKWVDKIGFRTAAITAQVFSAVGLVLLAVLPRVMYHSYAALIISAIIYAVGAGFQETVLSPIVDSVSDEINSGALNFLHSFYSVGQCVVVAVTTVFIKVFGENYWYILPYIWALLPIYNIYRFLKVPLKPTLSKQEKTPVRELFSSRAFIVAVILMVGAGASELSMVQWSSMFAEQGLHVSKLTGDLLGPCLFAVFMGIGRVLCGKLESKINMKRVLAGCSLLCIVCYMTAALSLNGYLALAGCALCGLSVSAMWPGTLTLSSANFPKGGAAMFSILALFGDIGCSFGPWLSGKVSDISQSSKIVADCALKFGLEAEQAGLRCGMLISAVFPLMMFICLITIRTSKDKRK